jgi:hypothetical protein
MQKSRLAFTTVFTPNTLVGFQHEGQTYDIDVNTQKEGNSARRRCLHCSVVIVQDLKQGLSATVM